MYSKILLTTIVFVLSVLSVSQTFAQDSTKSLKRQQEILTIEKRLVDNKLKLETLQKSLATKTEDLNTSMDDVQSSANKNQDAADDLQDNATSKKHARKAKKAAKEAKRSAKQARKSKGRKSGVEEDIESLEKTIRKDESELEKLRSKNLSFLKPATATYFHTV